MLDRSCVRRGLPFQKRHSLKGADKSLVSTSPVTREGSWDRAVRAEASEDLSFSDSKSDIIPDISSATVVYRYAISRNNRQTAQGAADSDSPEPLYATISAEVRPMATDLDAVDIEQK